MTISKREYEVLDLLSLGYSSKEIANKLYISHATVATHRKNIFEKTKAKNVADLIRLAYETGVLHLKLAQ